MTPAAQDAFLRLQALLRESASSLTLLQQLRVSHAMAELRRALFASPPTAPMRRLALVVKPGGEDAP